MLVVSAVTACVLVGVGVVAVEAVGDSGWWCDRQETRGYPAVEAVAVESLGDLASQHQRSGACEDTGRPVARVISDVPTWSTRREARAYLVRQGWRAEDGLLVSADGTFRAEYPTTRDRAYEGDYVRVVFWEASAAE